MLQTSVYFCHQFLSPIGYIWGHYLCVLYRAEFSTHLFQIHTKYSLDPAPDPSIFLSPISDICGHQGAKFVFLVCALQPLVFNWFFPNLHQIFMGACVPELSIFSSTISDICGQQGANPFLVQLRALAQLTLCYWKMGLASVCPFVCLSVKQGHVSLLLDQETFGHASRWPMALAQRSH